MRRIFLPILFIIISYMISKQGYQMVSTFMKPPGAMTVVIDAGHGGSDPGKVGINDILEKEINLQIAQYLKHYLEVNNIRVVMTREDDHGLSSSTHNSKISDLSNRKEIIFQSNPVATISIHQNSYPSPSVSGAQVFYGQANEKSKALAEILQKQLLELDPENHRSAKANHSYFLFKDNPYPTVIVECGFLSNPDEASWLKEPDYQKKIAWSLHLGIMEYLNKSRIDSIK